MVTGDQGIRVEYMKTNKSLVQRLGFEPGTSGSRDRGEAVAVAYLMASQGIGYREALSMARSAL